MLAFVASKDAVSVALNRRCSTSSFQGPYLSAAKISAVQGIANLYCCKDGLSAFPLLVDEAAPRHRMAWLMPCFVAIAAAASILLFAKNLFAKSLTTGAQGTNSEQCTSAGEAV